jgi:hypothetical protein
MNEISLRVGDATLTVEYIGREYDSFREYRPRYQYIITPDDLAWQYVGDDISGPMNGGIDVESAMCALLSFLGACAESRSYGDGTGENSTLFPAHVGEWAEQYSDEINLAPHGFDPTD